MLVHHTFGDIDGVAYAFVHNTIGTFSTSYKEYYGDLFQRFSLFQFRQFIEAATPTYSRTTRRLLMTCLLYLNTQRLFATSYLEFHSLT
jgi:hypothetical protein